MEQRPPPPDLHHERWELLQQIDRALDKPLIALSFVWLGLLIYDFTQNGLSPLLQTISYGIWAIFILDFVLGIIIAPRKVEYLRRNWLTAVSLVLPALRAFRIFQAFRLLRAARATRSLNLVRLLTSVNRGMRTLSNTLGRRGIGFVVALTTIITFAGAAGMYAFESPAALAQANIDARGLPSYGEAVWWTAMIMTTMGSEYWPQTAEGRILGWLLALYAFAIFGYITATIASFFVGQDTSAQAQSTAPAADTAALRDEIAALRQELALLRGQGAAAPQLDNQ
jgi:voltage-gated potassium channel